MNQYLAKTNYTSNITSSRNINISSNVALQNDDSQSNQVANGYLPIFDQPIPYPTQPTFNRAFSRHYQQYYKTNTEEKKRKKRYGLV